MAQPKDDPHSLEATAEKMAQILAEHMATMTPEERQRRITAGQRVIDKAKSRRPH